jgi:methionyl-tRNA synthetase
MEVNYCRHTNRYATQRSIVRSCNSRCWEARGKVCRCVCGGGNHGCRLNLDELFGAPMQIETQKAFLEKSNV